MRGALWAIILLIAITPIAAKELNTTTYVAGDSFRIDGTTYLIKQTFVERVHMEFRGAGKIFSEDDCEITPFHKFCIKKSANTSADITLHSRDFNLTLERDAPKKVDVGEEFEITLQLQNKAEKDLQIKVQENTPLAVISRTGFDDRMAWEGTLKPGQGRTLKYEARALVAGEYTLRANVDAAYPTSDTHDITAEDYADITIKYTNSTTADAVYNWSATIDQVADVEGQVIVILPNNVQSSNKGSFRINGDTLHWSEQLNKTHKIWFTYKTIKPGEEQFRVEFVTEKNDTRTTREYLQAIEQSGFGQPIIIHDHDQKELVVGKKTDLPVQIHNPNDRTMTVDMKVTSVLLNKQQTLTLTPNETETLIFTVQANTSTSRYNLVIDLTYDDDNGEEITQQETIRLLGAEPRTLPTPTKEPSMTATWQTRTENATLTITPKDINSTATLSVYRDGTLITNKTVQAVSGQTITVQAEGYGSYDVQLHAGTVLLEQSLTLDRPVETPEQTETIETEETGSAGGYLIAIGIAVIIGTIIAATYMAVAPRLRTNRMDDLYKESLTLQQEIDKDGRFLKSFYPASNEDLTLKHAMESELNKKESILSQKMDEIERLRGKTIKRPLGAKRTRGGQ